MALKHNTYADIILPLAVQGLFTYEVVDERDVDVGRRVVVQFGRGQKMYTGIVAEVHGRKPEVETKPVIECLDEAPIVGLKSIELWKWMSVYYLCSIGEVMHAALPGMLNLSSESRVMLNPESEINFSLLDPQMQVLVNTLERGREMAVAALLKQVGKYGSLRTIKKMTDDGLLTITEQIDERFRPKKVKVIGLGTKIRGHEDVSQTLKNLIRAPAQMHAFLIFLELIDWKEGADPNKTVKKSYLMRSSASGNDIIRTLTKKGILEQKIEIESRLDDVDEVDNEVLQELNEYQVQCFDAIREQFADKETVLLHGVTSSGKTEIYAHLIRDCLQTDKQVLYLLPEIALTNQLIKRLRKYFGSQVGVYHSRLGQNEQVEVWKRVAANAFSHRVIVGARSSLFLPFQNLGLVIVDEEHDRSFKQQDPAPRYSARDSAMVLAQLYGAKVLLGSATPSLESLANAREGKYGFVEMKERFGGFEMPEMEAIDLLSARRRQTLKGSFSTKLISGIRETLEGGEQVILFRNQRGYAPFVICGICSHTPHCINCDVSLTYHRRRHILLCHYCNYKRDMQDTCEECGKGNFEYVGSGTERLEEELSQHLPTATIARFDMDSTRSKYGFQQLLDEFENREIEVLIGTQMVTKGLDFENVGLVGIINADNMMRFPDFRSFERTFQMLTQVAGRTGRKKKRGKVVIQTYDPHHPVIKRVLESDYSGFTDLELQERMAFRYPPYVRMIELVMQHRDRQALYDAARLFGDKLRLLFGSSLIGPEFPPIERIRNLFAMHFILKFSKQVSISREKKKLAGLIASLSSKDNFKMIKIKIDVDPY